MPASVSDEKPGVCYLFSGEQLLDKGVCVVTSGGGAGRIFKAAYFKDKDYIAVTALCSDKKADEYVGCGTKLNGQIAKYYFRNMAYLEASSDEVDPDEDGLIDGLYCYASKKIDICYK